MKNVKHENLVCRNSRLFERTDKKLEFTLM